SALVILTALAPIAPAQDPVLGHVVADVSVSALLLEGAVNVIDEPAPISRAVRFLGLDHIMDRISDATRFWIESDVAEQFERARGQIAASWIENRVVVRERHVFEPRGRDIFIKRRPPAVA